MKEFQQPLTTLIFDKNNQVCDIKPSDRLMSEDADIDGLAFSELEDFAEFDDIDYMPSLAADMYPLKKGSVDECNEVIEVTEKVKKQFRQYSEEIDEAWSVFLEARNAYNEFLGSCNSGNSVLNAIFLIKKKDQYDCLEDNLERIELALKKASEKLQKVLKGSGANIMPDWLKKVSDKVLEIEGQMQINGVDVSSRVSLSD